MERWLRHRLACSPLQISANLEFPFPAQALAGVFPGVVDGDAAWDPDSLVWSILDLVPEVIDAPELEPLRGWLRRERPEAVAAVSRDRFALARECAEVLDRACLFRPDWIEAWEGGVDPPVRPGAPSHAAPPAAWQRVLWCAVRKRLPTPPPAHRFGVATPEGGDPLHVFAVSSMPPRWLDAWRRAGSVRDIFYYLLAPSDLYWGDLKTRAELRRTALRSGAEEAAIQLAAQNPILTSLGRLARDTAELLLEAEAADVDLPDAFPDPDSESVLGALQADVIAVRSADELRALAAARPIRREDDSIRFHNCHGPTRQVEALREALLELLDAHPHLQPRDVLVMTPDIAAYAPLVQAAFGEGGKETGGPRIPAHIADLGLKSLNPLADALLRVLALAPGRLTATAFADLAAVQPVRQRFGLDDDDLARLRTWLAAAGARWGADADERNQHGNPAQHLFTFAFAFERLALGVTLADAGPEGWRGVAPFDEMEGASVATFGKVAELLARLERWRKVLAAPRTMAEWGVELLAVVDDLAEVSASASFLRGEIVEGVEAIVNAAAPFEGAVSLDVIATLLDGRFEKGRGGDRPSGGAVSVCALTPMRSVPFRVICLLGMDDGAFPRTPAGRGFDATLSAPRPGDRDPREEDRNLLLEAILSAREHLHIFYTGRDTHTDKALAPCVPVGDLLDVIDLSFASPFAADLAGARPARDALTVRHAVQPFSASGFAAADPWPAAPRPRRFDGRMAAAAAALAGRRGAAPVLFPPGCILSDPMPPPEISIDELIRWLTKPVRQLIKTRVGLHLDEDGEELIDRDALAVDALEGWALGKAMCGAWLAGETDGAALFARLTARGQLPPGAPGRAVFGAAWSRVQLAATALPEWVVRGPLVRGPVVRGPVAVRVVLPGATVVGSVLMHGSFVVDFGADAPAKPRRLVDAWVRVLALQASGAVEAASALLVGVEKDSARTVVLSAPTGARERLSDLVALWRLARTRPLPLVEKTSHAFAEALHDVEADELAGALVGAVGAAEGQWEGGGMPGGGECVRPALAAAFADHSPWISVATSDLDPEFVALAARLWTPIFQAVSVDTDGGAGA